MNLLLLTQVYPDEIGCETLRSSSVCHYWTKEWVKEECVRAEKRKSKKPHYAKMTSVFAKLDNELAKAELAAKKKSKKENK